MRVRLQIDHPGAAELHALPWERIYHYQRGQEVALAATGLTPFSRYTGLEATEPAPVQARKLQLLFAIANPKDMPFDEIKVEREVESLLQALDDLRQAGRFRITVMPGRTRLSPDLRGRLDAAGVEVAEGPTTPENILRRLPDCHVFHFLGHGSFERAGARGEGVSHPAPGGRARPLAPLVRHANRGSTRQADSDAPPDLSGCVRHRETAGRGRKSPSLG